MALNTFECNHLTALCFKGLNNSVQTCIRSKEVAQVVMTCV